jgi:glycosyltransferase involved in cell wall biosynthesis
MDLVPEGIRQVSGGLNPVAEMRAFIDKFKPDTILTWEWPGRWEFPAIWAEKGIRWVNVVHWDWFPAERLETLRKADLVAPNRVCQEGLAKIGLTSTLLPVPLDISKFTFVKREKAKRFGMAYGAGGANGRRSLVEVLEALESMESPPNFVVKSQVNCKEFKKVLNAELVVANTFDPQDVYKDFDVAVQPSKFEGVGLSILEAEACGVPVITVDAEPMRTLAPDLLVTATPSDVSNMSGAVLQAWKPDIKSIAWRIGDVFGKDIGDLSSKARSNAEKFSWDSLKKQWEAFLIK